MVVAIFGLDALQFLSLHPHVHVVADAARFEQIEADMPRPRTSERSRLLRPWYGLATPGSPKDYGELGERITNSDNDTNRNGKEAEEDNDGNGTITDTPTQREDDYLPSP